MTPLKTLEELRTILNNEKFDLMELLVERLDDLPPFQQGVYKGQIMALDNMSEIIRNTLKYGNPE